MGTVAQRPAVTPGSCLAVRVLRTASSLLPGALQRPRPLRWREAGKILLWLSRRSAGMRRKEPAGNAAVTLLDGHAALPPQRVLS